MLLQRPLSLDDKARGRSVLDNARNSVSVSALLLRHCVMNRSLMLLCCGATAAFSLALAQVTRAAVSPKEARVTQVIRDVKLLPSDDEPRAAALNDAVREGIAVRTGDQSRSELTFTDVTISRLGANTLFTFNKAGRSVELGGGSVLVRVPKDSGGGNVRTNAVTVAITGTTLILETSRGGRSKLIVLEGGARLSLVKYRGQSRQVRGGQCSMCPQVQQRCRCRRTLTSIR
jgi:hypothetical protein